MEASSPVEVHAKMKFEAQVVREFQRLAAKNFNANEAAAMALKFASGAVIRPLDPKAFVLEAQNGADLRVVLTKLASMFSSPETLAATFAQKFRSADAGCSGQVQVDFEALDAVYYSFTDDNTICSTLVSACHRLAECLQPSAIDDPSGSTSVVAALALLENPLLEETENHWLLASIAGSVMQWPDGMLHRLVGALSRYTPSRISSLLHRLQQWVSVYLHREQHVDGGLETMVKLVGLLYRANEEGGMLSFTDFYNTSINQEEFSWREDYLRWKFPTPGVFSFCTYPYLYDPAAKQRILQLENRKEQEGEFQHAILSYLLTQGSGSAVPYLILKVRRGPNLITDTLHQIQQHAQRDQLKKPLKVQFVGEDGIDEGGVQKEFFQLIFRGMFDPNYGMFVCHETTRTSWFRSSTLDMSMEFELVGILLGLAIYNNHILEIAFPLLVYRKLMGHKPTFDDLREVHPEIHSSLGKMLEYEGDVEDFSLFFQVEQDGEFGEGQRVVDLVDGGGDLPVTNANRGEYARLYTAHLLERSIQRQYSAFKRGFLKLCESPALALFRPEELELLICGSQRLDFRELEAGTAYEGGYQRSHESVRWFWEVAAELPLDKKKRLLFFVTGSDRVPIRGLANLSPQFTIARNGPHSRRLPTAHTCFNHLLMPQYRSKAVLRERLLTAIENAEGFGLK